MKLGSFLLLGSLCALSTAYSAVIVDAPPYLSHSGLVGGPAVSADVRAGQYWSSPRPYRNVSISIEVNNLSLGQMSFDWYLTDSVGPGTTVANEYAHGSFPLAAQSGGLRLLTSGLDLPAGIFYLTLAASGCGGPNTCAAWPSYTPLSGPLVIAPGVTVVSGASWVGDVFPPYVPAANYSYFAQNSLQVMLVTGDEVPEPALSFAVGAAALLIAVRRRANL